MTLQQAQNLIIGQTLYHVTNRNADGTPQRWRVTGRVKEWKRSPGKISIPIRYGLYSNDHLTENSLGFLVLSEEEAYAIERRIK